MESNTTLSYRRKNWIRLTCAKCGATPDQEPSLRLHRFPLPGSRGPIRARAWAEYTFPDRDWTCEEDLVRLHNMNNMLCSKHFDDNSYTNSSKTKLHIFALPSGSADIYARLRKFDTCKSHNDHNYAGVDVESAVGVKPSIKGHPPANPSMGGTVGYPHSPSYKIADQAQRHKKRSSPLPDPECDDTQDEVVQEDAVEVKQEQDEQATLTRVCRGCLQYCSDARDMTPLLHDGKLTETAQALVALSPQIQISSNDPLPKQLCGACAREAIGADRFCRRVEQTHARLATLAPDDIVQYSLSLAHYFPDHAADKKVIGDDNSVLLKYDGERQHLELWLNTERASPTEPIASTDLGRLGPDDGKNKRKRRATRESEATPTSDADTKLVFVDAKKFLPLSGVGANKEQKQIKATDDIKRKRRMTDGYENIPEPQKIFLEIPNSTESASETVVGEYDEDVIRWLKSEESETTFENNPLSHEEGSFYWDTTFRCVECHTDFMTRLECERHIDSAHGPVPAYVCHECGQCIATKRRLREHLHRHSGVAPYECQRCHSKFFSRGDRRRHYVMCAAVSANVVCGSKI